MRTIFTRIVFFYFSELHKMLLLNDFILFSMMMAAFTILKMNIELLSLI